MLRRKLVLLLCVGALVLSLTGCGNSEETFVEGDLGIDMTQETNAIVYKEHSVKNLKYELPEDWVIESEPDGSGKAINLEDSSFNIYVSSDIPETLFADFCKRHVVGLFQNMDYTTLKSYKENEYNSIKAYDYDVETIIKGDVVPVKATALHVENDIIMFMLICGDDDYNYMSIYENLLDSLKIESVSE